MLVPLSAVMQNSGNSLTLRSTGAELASTAAFDRYQYHALDEDTLSHNLVDTCLHSQRRTAYHPRRDST